MNGNGNDDRPIREVLTTGQVAHVLGCSMRTASKVIDAGHIPGFKIPGTADRRVGRAHLLAAIAGRPDHAACLDRLARIDAGELLPSSRKRQRREARRLKVADQGEVA